MGQTIALLDRDWIREPNRFNPTTGERTGAQPPTHFLPAGCARWEVEKDYPLESYLDWVVAWLKKGGRKINRLILSSHGNNGKLYLGRGLSIENAGMFQKLNGWFDMSPGAERVVAIYGCGVGSDTPVGLAELDRDPQRWPADIRKRVADLTPLKPGEVRSFVKDGVPHDIVYGKTANTLLTRGSRNPQLAGTGYKFLKALANCTQAYVSAPVHQTSNFPPYFRYNVQVLWVYPDTKKQEEAYRKKNGEYLAPHRDGTADEVLL